MMWSREAYEYGKQGNALKLANGRGVEKKTEWGRKIRTENSREEFNTIH